MIDFTKWWVCTGVTRKVQMIGNARVPLLMFVDAQANIACDVSVDNGSALFKSRVLRWITDMDPRCRCLIFLVSFSYGINQSAGSDPYVCRHLLVGSLPFWKQWQLNFWCINP
jgi:hypothetical protein